MSCRRIAEFQNALDAHPFRPARGMGNAHTQTLYGPWGPPRRRLAFTIEAIPTPDGDRIFLHHLQGRTGGPVAVLLHGLEGSADSPYIRGVARRLNDIGFTIVAMEHRSCGTRMNLAPRLYHSGVTDDLDTVVKHTTSRYAGRPIVLFGVSLGGNQLGKYLGTHNVPSELRAAAILSPPFDLSVSGPHMDRCQGVYVRHFLRSLIPKALAKEAQYPGLIDRQRVAASTTFAEFDTHATAAMHGFKDATDYYERVSCGQFLHRISVPTLLIAAHDDPFNPGSTIPTKLVREHEMLCGSFPERGGHVGFVGGTALSPRFWAEEQAATFFEFILQD